MMITKPQPSTVPEYYQGYFKLIEENDLMKELSKSKNRTNELFNSIRDENHRYKEGKWTIKEVLQHIIDCERIFNYRAFRFSRFDNTPLAGFDEDAYIANGNTAEVPLKTILEEYNAVRESSIYLFKSMTEEMLDFKGNANNLSVTARGIGFMIVGHNLHHCNVVKDLYL